MIARLALVAASLAICVGGAAGGTAGGEWAGHMTGLVPGGSSDVEVAVGNGTAIAVWSAYPRVQASVRAGDHRWSPPTTVGEGLFPRVVMDRAGNAVVTMTQGAGTTWRVVSYARDAATGSWTGPVPVSDGECDTGHEDLAMNDRGDAISVWSACESGPGSLTVVRAAMRRPDGTWERPLNLGYSATWNDADAAVDANGNAVVVWARNGIYAESRVAGRWENAIVLSTRSVEARPYVAMNARGDALAVWGESGGHLGLVLMSSLRRSGTSTWTTPAQVAVSEPAKAIFYYYGVSFALDDAGNAVLATHRSDGQIEVATRAFEADTWAGPTPIGSSGAGPWYATDGWCVGPRVAVDRKGDAVVIWGGLELRAARRVGGQWRQPVAVAASPACFQRDLDVDGDGNAVAVWNAGAGEATRVDAAVLDVSAPALGRVVAPGTARVGRRARFAVSATDTWTNLSAPLWRFGDGARARGAVVRHVFRRPGRYRVTVSAADEAGNVATRSAVVRVR